MKEKYTNKRNSIPFYLVSIIKDIVMVMMGLWERGVVVVMVGPLAKDYY